MQTTGNLKKYYYNVKRVEATKRIKRKGNKDKQNTFEV